MKDKNHAKISILSELLSFATIRNKDWTSVYADSRAVIGDLVALSTAPPSKWYVSWLRDYDPNNGWPKYLLESIEDGELCWWENVGLSFYNRERIKDNPQWTWNDKQYVISNRWYKVCRKHEIYPVRPCQPIFNADDSVVLDVRIHLFFQENFHNPKVFANYKRLTIKDMVSHYLDGADKYQKQEVPKLTNAK